MNQKLMADFSLSAQTLGAFFSYNPADSRVNPLITLFQSGEWMTEWPFAEYCDCQRINQLLADSQQEKQLLAGAYQQLFMGKHPLVTSPWGSVYLDEGNNLFGISTLSLRAWLRNNQINIELKQDEPEDHVGLLLLLAAWIAENKPEKLKELLEAHLLPWVYRYLEKMQEYSNSTFYQAIALLASQTLRYVQQEMALTPAHHTLYF